MLDLSKLEAEIDDFIANQTTESYNSLFKQVDEMDFIEKVEISGGYTDDFSCKQEIMVDKMNVIASDCDFYDQDLNMAA